MKHFPGRQKGASPFVSIVILAVLAYGVFVGIQYVPQVIESRSIQSILDSVQSAQDSDPVTTVDAARAKVIRMLQVNEMSDMTEDFSVARRSDAVEITFSYDRSLNLLFETRPVHYEMSVRLERDPGLP
jgi:outer membrane lipopolysaccharide assembly protein LptE/RlpB